MGNSQYGHAHLHKIAHTYWRSTVLLMLLDYPLLTRLALGYLWSLFPSSDLGLSTDLLSSVLCMTSACLTMSLISCQLTTSSLTLATVSDYASCFALYAVTCLPVCSTYLFLQHAALTFCIQPAALTPATCFLLWAVCRTISSPRSCCSSHLESTCIETSTPTSLICGFYGLYVPCSTLRDTSSAWIALSAI